MRKLNNLQTYNCGIWGNTQDSPSFPFKYLPNNIQIYINIYIHKIAVPLWQDVVFLFNTVDLFLKNLKHK